MFPQEVLIHRFGDSGKGGMPLIQERFKLPVVQALDQVDVLGSIVGPELFTGFVILMHNQEQLPTSDGTLLGLLLSSVPDKLLLDPGLVRSIAVGSNTKRFGKLRIKTPVLVARASHGTHGSIAKGRGLDPVPDFVTTTRRSHDGISKTTAPLRVLGNRLQGFKLNLTGLSLVPMSALSSTTVRRSPIALWITSTTTPTSSSRGGR